MFWTRALLKSNAKQVLSTSYWRMYLACLIVSIVSNGLTQVVLAFTLDTSARYRFTYAYASDRIVTALLFNLVFSFAWLIFVGNPISVGQNRFTMENRIGEPPYASLFSVFQDMHQYWNVTKVMLQFYLEIFLWSLLLVVPGIYKSYQYVYIPYLLAENPYMSYARAKELSRAMTEGEKMEIFILQFSFFGWIFLISLVTAIVFAGIASSILNNLLTSFVLMFLSVYISATFAELYAAARAKAFSLNITGTDELADFESYK